MTIANSTADRAWPTPILLVGVLAGLWTGGCSGWPETVQEKRAFGDARLRAFREHLASAPDFTFTADEYHLRSPGGQKLQEIAELAKRDLVREVAVRRPNAAWFGARGDRKEQVWYSESTLTRISDDEKSWTQEEIPGDLDLALGAIGERIDLLRPMTDLLSGALWDDALAPERSGGWVSIETIGKKKCDRLVYSQERVDWQLWIEEGKRALPCQIMLVYKNEPGPARSTLVFRDWNFAADASAERFKATIPAGYERLGMLGRASEVSPAAPAAVSPAADSDR